MNGKINTELMEFVARNTSLGTIKRDYNDFVYHDVLFACWREICKTWPQINEASKVHYVAFDRSVRIPQPLPTVPTANTTISTWDEISLKRVEMLYKVFDAPYRIEFTMGYHAQTDAIYLRGKTPTYLQTTPAPFPFDREFVVSLINASENESTEDS